MTAGRRTRSERATPTDAERGTDDAARGRLLRYRFYTGWGLSPGDVGRIVMFSGVTVAAGACTTGGLAALLAPEFALAERDVR